MSRLYLVEVFACGTYRRQTCTLTSVARPGGCLDIKMSSYQYRNSHYKDNTVFRPSYLYNGNPIPGKTVFIERRGPGYGYPTKAKAYMARLDAFTRFSINIMGITWYSLCKHNAKDFKEVVFLSIRNHQDSRTDISWGDFGQKPSHNWFCWLQN